MNALFDMGEQNVTCTLQKRCYADMVEDELKRDKNQMKEWDNMVIISNDVI